MARAFDVQRIKRAGQELELWRDEHQTALLGGMHGDGLRPLRSEQAQRFVRQVGWIHGLIELHDQWRSGFRLDGYDVRDGRA